MTIETNSYYKPLEGLRPADSRVPLYLARKFRNLSELAMDKITDRHIYEITSDMGAFLRGSERILSLEEIQDLDGEEYIQGDCVELFSRRPKVEFSIAYEPPGSYGEAKPTAIVLYPEPDDPEDLVCHTEEYVKPIELWGYQLFLTEKQNGDVETTRIPQDGRPDMPFQWTPAMRKLFLQDLADGFLAISDEAVPLKPE